MNIDKLADRLANLGDLRPEGAMIALCELSERNVRVVVAGLGVEAIEFDDSLNLAKLPEGWMTILPNGADCETLSPEKITAVRQALEERIRTRSWHLALPDTLCDVKQVLGDQHAQGIEKPDKFRTISFRLKLELPACSFRAHSVKLVQLDCLLSVHELKAIFDKCR